MLRNPFSLSRDELELVCQERTRNRQTIQSQLRAAVQKYKDAQNTSVSDPTRLDAAYDAILFCALAVFAAQGYRISSKPGHHRIAMEGLAGTLNPVSHRTQPHRPELPDRPHTIRSAHPESLSSTTLHRAQLCDGGT